MTLDDCLFGISAACQIMLLIVLVKRKLTRVFPVLTGYMIYLVITDPIALECYRLLSDRRFEQVYVVFTISDYIFQIGILVEVIGALVAPIRTQVPNVRVIAVGAMICCGVVTAICITRGSNIAGLDPLGRIFLRWHLAFSVFRVAAVMTAFTTMRVLGVGWQKQAVRVAVGISIYALMALLVQVAHELTGEAGQVPSIYAAWERVSVVGWIACLIYLSWYLVHEGRLPSAHLLDSKAR